MQYSCFHFVAIISANTEYNTLHSRLIPTFAENISGVHYSVVILSILFIIVRSTTLLEILFSISGGI